MLQASSVESIASSRDAIGASAARRLELAFRDMMGGQGAVLGERYLRQITREPHPFGNLAVISDSTSHAITDQAVTPLLDVDVATMVLYAASVSDKLARRLLAHGYGRAAMPAI